MITIWFVRIGAHAPVWFGDEPSAREYASRRFCCPVIMISHVMFDPFDRESLAASLNNMSFDRAAGV